MARGLQVFQNTHPAIGARALEGAGDAEPCAVGRGKPVDPTVAKVDGSITWVVAGQCVDQAGFSGPVRTRKAQHCAGSE